MSDFIEQEVVGHPGQPASSEAGGAAGVLPAAAVEVPLATVAPVAAAGATAVQAPVPPDRPRRWCRSEKETAYLRGVVDDWHRLVAKAVDAGGPLPTVRGFCEQRQLREPSFYWWRKVGTRAKVNWYQGNNARKDTSIPRVGPPRRECVGVYQC